MSHHDGDASAGHSPSLLHDGHAGHDHDHDHDGHVGMPAAKTTVDASKERCKLCHRRKLSQHGHERVHPPFCDDNCCPDTDMHVVEQQRPIKDCNTDHFHPPPGLPRRKSSLSRMQRPDLPGATYDNDLLGGFSPQAEMQYTTYKQSYSTLQSIAMIDENEARARHAGHDEHADGQGEFSKEIAALNGGWMDGTRHPGHVIP